MNTPYQWTKQVASHFGGTRDGLVVHWPGRHQCPRRGPPPVPPRHRRAARRSSTPPDCRCPRPTTACPSSGSRAPRCATASTTPDAEDRRRTQYFEMVGNRGIYHEGWTAVTRHGLPWKMTEEPRPFDRDTWELYDIGTDWSQARDLAADDPERLARLQALFDEEAEKHQVFPLDDRVTERENPELAGRSTCTTAGTGWCSVVTPAGCRRRRRPTSRTARTGSRSTSTSRRTTRRSRPTGCWSPRAAASAAGRSTSSPDVPTTPTTATARTSPWCAPSSVLWPGEHEVVLDFSYDGGPPGSGGLATIADRRRRCGPGVDRGDHGVLLRLRRVLQRRHRPGQPGRRRLPTGAQRLHRRDPPRRRRPRRGHRAGRRGQRPAGQPAPTTEGDRQRGAILAAACDGDRRPGPGSARARPASADPRC